MVNYFRSYFHLLVHPVLALEHEQALSSGQAGPHAELFPVNLTLPLKILVSWPFQMLETCYTFIALALGSLYAEHLFADLAYELGLQFSLTPLVMLSLGMVVFFPLQEWVEIKVWEYMVWLGLQLFQGDAPAPRMIGERLALCLSTHSFRAIPLLGGFAAKWGKLVSIGIVLVRGYELSFLQALVILLMPMLFLGLMLALVLLSVLSILAL